MNKVHMLKTVDVLSDNNVTYCGHRGWEERGVADEYTTIDGSRFEATIMVRRVTCKRCLSIIANEPATSLQTVFGKSDPQGCKIVPTDCV